MHESPWQFVIAVLGSPRLDDFNLAAIPLDRKGEPTDEIALPNLRQQTRIVLGQRRRSVEIQIDLFGETDV